MHIIFTSIYDELPDKLQSGLRLHVLQIEATDEINEHNACSAFSVSICTFVLGKQVNRVPPRSGSSRSCAVGQSVGRPSSTHTASSTAVTSALASVFVLLYQ